MTPNSAKFDAWIRSTFVELNTALEELYFAQEDRADVSGVGDDVKEQIRHEGEALIDDLVAEGNTDEGFDAAFDLLGNLGLYLAAMRRHELTNPAREDTSPFRAASALGLHIAASLGVAPRFATSHLTTHNRARGGVFKTFTHLPDEYLFVEYNAYGILSFKRAAAALVRLAPMGVSSPFAPMLLHETANALRDVLQYNETLFDKLDTDRFFFNVRPYYKPYRVGRQEYRGANAGDFSGINVIDLLLGLCRANDPSYAQMLVDKMLFMMPADQAELRDVLRRRSLLDELLALAPDHASAPWFQENTRAFLTVCDLYAQTARQHHDQLVRKFIEAPSHSLDSAHMQGLTASGPPLDVLMRALENLRDRRAAAERGDLDTRHDDLGRLRDCLTDGPA